MQHGMGQIKSLEWWLAVRICWDGWLNGLTFRYLVILTLFRHAIGHTFRYLQKSGVIRGYFHQIADPLSVSTGTNVFFSQIADRMSVGSCRIDRRC